MADVINARTEYTVISDAIWKTTAPDGIIEIANADDRGDSYPGVTHSQQCAGAYNCPRAGLHDQFAELNGESVGSLYQDVMTIPGTPIRWSLMHRGRYGVDSMYVVVMNTKAVLEKSIITQEMIEKIIRKEIDVPGARIWQISDGNTAWGTHDNNNDPYIVPEGQFVTRFFFVAGQTAVNPNIGRSDPRGGNLLDDVKFSTELPPPPSDDQCEIVIRKTVRFLSTDVITGSLIPALRFRVTELGNTTMLNAGEAARWARNGQTRATWLAACDDCLDFISNRLPHMTRQYRERGWYPSIDAPTISITAGKAMFAGTNPVYYTLDGRDPQTDGVLAPEEGVTLPADGTTVVRARCRSNSGEWSAMDEVTVP